jgi:hypothetical protein
VSAAVDTAAVLAVLPRTLCCAFAHLCVDAGASIEADDCQGGADGLKLCCNLLCQLTGGGQDEAPACTSNAGEHHITPDVSTEGELVISANRNDATEPCDPRTLLRTGLLPTASLSCSPTALLSLNTS